MPPSQKLSNKCLWLLSYILQLGSQLMLHPQAARPRVRRCARRRAAGTRLRAWRCCAEIPHIHPFEISKFLTQVWTRNKERAHRRASVCSPAGVTSNQQQNCPNLQGLLLPHTPYVCRTQIRRDTTVPTPCRVLPFLCSPSILAGGLMRPVQTTHVELSHILANLSPCCLNFGVADWLRS